MTRSQAKRIAAWFIYSKVATSVTNSDSQCDRPFKTLAKHSYWWRCGRDKPTPKQGTRKLWQYDMSYGG